MIVPKEVGHEAMGYRLIICDSWTQDFASNFWMVTSECFGLQVWIMRTAYHPSNRRAKRRAIQTLEDMLRACAIDFGKGWVNHFPLVEFSYNNSYHASIKAVPFEALYGRKCHSPICWNDGWREALNTGPELIQRLLRKSSAIKQRMQSVIKFMLKVSPWKGVVRLAKGGSLNPRKVAEFNHTFMYLICKKSFHARTLAVPLDGLHLDDKLHFVEEPLEIVGREVKRLKRSRIPLVKVRWNSKRGPEFTWEREDQFKKKTHISVIKTTPCHSAAL
ncbi:putative reverse transcriptase domain-containing protein [Tanacetum coccineum]